MVRSKKNCIFCDIVVGVEPSYKIYEDDLTLCILDIHPFSQGHCLVIPKRHVLWWQELTNEEVVRLFHVAKVVAGKIMKTFSPDFVCMYARGRRIPHTHIFLVPTFSGDVLDRFFNALELFQESPESLAALKDEKLMNEVAKRLKKFDFCAASL